MPFEVDFNWASQAVIETVAVPFPSLETPPDVVVADPPVPQLAFQQSGPVTVTMLGCGRWNRDTSYRFNAGCNGGKWNLVLTRNGAVFNFHVAVQPAHA
ncbi:hypothetical protein [Micromonospora sp. DT227]|uniref:hypothetical protein n=1 Tax=Micromonospora sp. DT227 TaxID=3393433 RepID=UPI003CF3FCE9